MEAIITDISSIASASIDMHIAQTQQSAGISLLKKTMDMQQSSCDALIQSMDSVAPTEHQLDLLVWIRSAAKYGGILYFQFLKNFFINSIH